MIITQPPNIGAGGALFFGLGSTGLGLVAGLAAAVSWLRGRKSEPRVTAPLPAWEKRLRFFAAGLIAAGAVVQSAGAVSFAHETADSDLSDTYAMFVVGLGISGAALLAAIPPALYRRSERRS